MVDNIQVVFTCNYSSKAKITSWFNHLEDHNTDHANKKSSLSKADDRQAIALPVVGAPFLAATVPLAAAGGLAVYGTYGDAIIALLNSFLGN